MSPFNLEACVRSNVLKLELYQTARYQYTQDGTKVFLDANENSFGPAISLTSPTTVPGGESRYEIDASNMARYPDPLQIELKQFFCKLRNDHSISPKILTPDNIYLGTGAVGVIDTIIRCFGSPGKDKILICPPTYAIYSLSAQVNDISIVNVPLLPHLGFKLDHEAIHKTISNDPGIKMVCLVSPNNPTSTVIGPEEIASVLKHPTWNGVVVVDEAYIDYSTSSKSVAEWVTEWPNLIVIQTLSKAFGMAGIRLGAAFSSPPIIRVLRSLSMPYSLPGPTYTLACKALSEGGKVMQQHKSAMEEQRTRLLRDLPQILGIGHVVGGVESNFLLFEILGRNGAPDNDTARMVCDVLAEDFDVVVRFRGLEHGCHGCIRVTIGTESEMNQLISGMKKILERIHGNRSG